MSSLRVLTSLLLATLIGFACAIRSRTNYEYEECRTPFQIPLGIGDNRIPNSAFAASSFNPKRPPYLARLGDTSGAWTANTQNSQQWLEVDLGARYFVAAVSTQGRRGSDEYVTEFYLRYSDDKSTWSIYTNEYGIPDVLIGNTDGDTAKRNTLRYPLVTRYLRFNPQRWIKFISMRIEVHGCTFTSEAASFGGSSYLQYDISQSPMQSDQTLLEMRIRTTQADGVIFYASGNQGDFILLQMSRGYLNFSIDLGSTQAVRGRTEVTAGSLLDDHQWHDIIVQRNRHELTVVVDRLESKRETNGLFYRLDLDKFIYVGGVPYFNQEGISVRYNFIGCVENVNFNGAKLITDAKNGVSNNIQRVGVVAYTCSIAASLPLTFATQASFMQITADTGPNVRVKLDFRTYDEGGQIFYHVMDAAAGSFVQVKLDENGYVAYKVVSLTKQVIEDVVRNTDVMSTTHTFTDGLWHTFSLVVDRTGVNCTVDRNVKVSNRALEVRSATEYIIGGKQITQGFRGCLRNLEVAAQVIDVKNIDSGAQQDVIIGSCGIRDRCTPNPCEHNGRCTQSWTDFFCDCDATGYKGQMCHISAYHMSCHLFKQYSLQEVEGRETATIDPDGSGPLNPFRVECEQNPNGQIVTYINHDSTNWIHVNGYQEPGSYVREIDYDATLLELTDVIERASSCQQFIAYQCNNSKLLAKPADSSAPAWGWWVGRTYQPMYYWGGAAPGSGKCSCGLAEKGCIGSSQTCNCDADNANQQTSDSGYLVHKDYLPVLELHFGDTGTVTDLKTGSHRLGALECEGDDMFDNVVTFRKADATLEYGTFEAETAGDIWFQFRTTATDGVMIHNTGEGDFIEIRLFQSYTVNFRYNTGNGVQVVSFTAPGPLNDDVWHTVHVEKNRKQAWMRIDDHPETSTDEDPDLIRLLDLTGPLVVGAAVDFNDGFVGCMRGLRVNGKLLDMKGDVERGNFTYGVSVGCVGKCMSSPCFNGGTCREKYSGYTCDCSYTPFRGWMCGREVGVNLQTNFMVRYTFDEVQGLSASDFGLAIVGFSTKKKQGILMQMRNQANTEYISIEMNNNGGVKVALDVGFERDEVNTNNDGIDFTNGQQHVVIVKRSNKGRHLFLQVDNYPPTEKSFMASDSSDTILDNPKYIFIGSNDTSNTARGFEGCIYRVQVDNIFPLKRAFQDPQPDFITLTPEGQVKEDMCGFEEYTQPPDPIETRPRGGDVINVTYPVDPNAGRLTPTESALIGVGTILLILLLIAAGVAIWYFFCYDQGGYMTYEAKGADMADNPDSAVVYNQTGLSDMSKQQEWFL